MRMLPKLRGKAIYVPMGAAREYGGLAFNVATQCQHRCRYCYVPARRMPREEFEKPGIPRLDKLAGFEMDCETLQAAGNTEPIFMSFLCDPCQPTVVEFTKQLIRLAHRYGQRVNLLTKGHWQEMASVQSEMLPGDIFGVTLTCHTMLARQWEPNAGDTDVRLSLLSAAKYLRGLETRVSFEPVLDPAWVLKQIQNVRPFVDLIQVGALNSQVGELEEVGALRRSIKWVRFARDVRFVLEGMPGDWYIKKSLAHLLGHPGGLRNDTVTR